MTGPPGLLAEVGAAMTVAYGADDACLDWWRARIGRGG